MANTQRSIKSKMPPIILVILFCLYSVNAQDSFDLPSPEYGPIFAEAEAVDRIRWPFLSRKITESLLQLNNDQERNLKVVSIASAQHQYIDGSKYTINGLFQAPNGTVNCDVIILEQEWVRFRHFEIKCGDEINYKVTQGTQVNIKPAI